MEKGVEVEVVATCDKSRKPIFPYVGASISEDRTAYDNRNVS